MRENKKETFFVNSLKTINTYEDIMYIFEDICNEKVQLSTLQYCVRKN